MKFTFEELNGKAALQHFEELGNLRIKIFREFPFLYEGNLEYERKYLNTYFEREESIVVLMRLDKRIVGASTALPLQFEEAYIQAPFLKAGFNVNEVMYFGESIILKEFRGHGAGREFFERRLLHAKNTPGIKTVGFCTALYDPKKTPSDFNSPVHLWKKYGFTLNPNITATYKWVSIGDTHETEKHMVYYTKDL